MFQNQTAWTSFECGCVWAHVGQGPESLQGKVSGSPRQHHSAALVLCLCSCHLATVTKPSLPSRSWAASLWSRMKQHKFRVSAACALCLWSPISELNWVGWEEVLQDSPFPHPSRVSKSPPSSSSYPTVAFKSKPKQEVSTWLLDPKARFPFKHLFYPKSHSKSHAGQIVSAERRHENAFAMKGVCGQWRLSTAPLGSLLFRMQIIITELHWQIWIFIYLERTVSS